MADDRIKAMKFQSPEYIPISISMLPAGWIKYREELEEIAKRHPLLFGESKGKRDYDSIGYFRYGKGEYVDAWGCVWSNIYHGHDAIVTGHPMPKREDVWKLRAPEKDDGIPHGFMFLRITDLRGYEEAMVDFAEEPPELQRLIDVVLEYNMRQVDILLKNTPKEQEVVGFGDDLGTQNALPISPVKWRKYLKPCYKKIYGRIHSAGHSVYMHTDGCIYEIIPDLIECGVDVINPQVRANGLDNLARTCKGKVCVSLDLDRQLFPFCSPKDIDEHVRESVEKLGLPEGGLYLHAEVDDGVPLDNIEAICVALEKYRGYFRK